MGSNRPIEIYSPFMQAKQDLEVEAETVTVTVTATATAT
jgi:hypothetical protein